MGDDDDVFGFSIQLDVFGGAEIKEAGKPRPAGKARDRDAPRLRVIQGGRDGGPRAPDPGDPVDKRGDAPVGTDLDAEVVGEDPEVLRP